MFGRKKNHIRFDKKFILHGSAAQQKQRLFNARASRYRSVAEHEAVVRAQERKQNEASISHEPVSFRRDAYDEEYEAHGTYEPFDHEDDHHEFEYENDNSYNAPYDDYFDEYDESAHETKVASRRVVNENTRIREKLAREYEEEQVRRQREREEEELLYMNRVLRDERNRDNAEEIRQDLEGKNNPNTSANRAADNRFKGRPHPAASQKESHRQASDLAPNSQDDGAKEAEDPTNPASEKQEKKKLTPYERRQRQLGILLILGFGSLILGNLGLELPQLKNPIAMARSAITGILTDSSFDAVQTDGQNVSVAVNSLDELTPETREAAELFLKVAKDRGLRVYITETYRSQARQNHLYAQGRSRPGDVVTWTKQSSHTDRTAFDIAQAVKGKEYSDDRFFQKCADIGREIGLEVGYDWNPKDAPHFQFKAGTTLRYPKGYEYLKNGSGV